MNNGRTLDVRIIKSKKVILKISYEIRCKSQTTHSPFILDQMATFTFYTLHQRQNLKSLLQNLQSKFITIH